ncbi:MAG: site-2 protease family protein, partial [Candidatus Saccharimonadales bacterium]
KLLDNQFTIKGDTKIIRNDVLAGYVEPGSPADKAGIKSRDKLISVETPSIVTYYDRAGNILSTDRSDGATNTVPLTSAEQLPGLTKQFQGETVKVTYERKGQRQTSEVKLLTAEEANGKGRMGISPTEFTMTRSTWSSPIVAAGLLGQFTAATFQGLGTAISAVFQGQGSKAAEQVSGPVGIVVILKDGSLLGYQFVLMVIAIISLTLAIMNVLPIPALDGGRLFMMLLSRAFGKKMTQEMEERIVGASFIFLLFLIVLITIVDVRRFF